MDKKKVKLNSPFRLPAGSKKKFGVYVKNEKGNIVKVTFGDPNMEIKRDDPNRRKNFRARHNCDNPGPKWKARYWSCYQWRAGTPVKAEIDEYVDITLMEMVLIPTVEEEPCCEECSQSTANNRPGLWENIRRKKMREGKNYRPAKPGDSDRPTQEQIERAKSLQMGKPSKNDPRKTPAPPKDQKRGSKKNPEGSAKKSNPSIEFSKETEARLQKIVSEHNAKSEKKVTIGMLKAVYRRGAGAFSTSHAPNMSRDGWAIARVRAFLYLVKNGKPSNPNYVQDNDLLPKGHSKKSEGVAIESKDNNVSKGSFDEFTKKDIFIGKQPKKKKFSQKAFEIVAQMNPYMGPQKPTDGDPKRKKPKK